VAFPFVVPALRTTLGIAPLNLMQWLLIAGVALSLLLIMEIGKAINNQVLARRAATS